MSQKKTELVRFLDIGQPSSVKGYSPAVVIDLGTSQMIIISGQVPLDDAGNLVGSGDIEKQTDQVFNNIKKVLEVAGGNMEHLVKLGMYVTDISKIQAIRIVRDKFINKKQPPASTLVEVSKLFKEGIMVEIEAIAIIPKK